MDKTKYDLNAIKFNKSAFGKLNPDWTKQRIKDRYDARRLADHICTRTPPNSFGDIESLHMSIILRNQGAFGGWLQGYEWLTELVAKRLIYRDGSL